MNSDSTNTVNTAKRTLPTMTGDIWTLSTDKDTIVIPTNVGWKSNGKNPMGKGLASQAARRFRFLPRLYGDFCRRHKANTPLLPIRSPRWCHLLLLLPTKELNPEKPYLSWHAETSPEALTIRLQQLNHFAHHFTLTGSKEVYYAPNSQRRILVPALGTGHGGLPLGLVETLLPHYLLHPSFTYIKYS